MAGLKDLYGRLDKNRKGGIMRREHDFAVRKGLCHEPTSERELFQFTVLHKVRELLTEIESKIRNLKKIQAKPEFKMAVKNT